MEVQMEKLMHIKPTKEYELQAIEYLSEFYEYNSEIEGVGQLHKYLDDYDGWLQKLEKDRKMVPDAKMVPTETFFLVREADNKIVGMINIRLALNERFKRFGGHIGYSIRPTERHKGYSKINLYLGLLCCLEHGIEEVLLDCDKANLGSAKTIQALGGKLVREYYEEDLECTVQDYQIAVKESLKQNAELYEPMVNHSVLKNNEITKNIFSESSKSAAEPHLETYWNCSEEPYQSEETHKRM